MPAYQAHVERIFNEYGPVTDEEKRLAHCVADTLWRLERIPLLEAGIYALGRRELAAQFADESDESVRRAMIEAHIFLTYRRDLNNLSIRRREQERCMHLAMDNYEDAQEQNMVFDPAEIGFEFSTDEIVARIAQQKRQGAVNGGRYYEFKKEGYFQMPEKAA